MWLISLAKKLFRTLARVIPQCGMVSQAVAFSMFPAFLPILLRCTGPGEQFSGRGESCGRAFGDSAPGQLAAHIEFLLLREVNDWHWALLGSVGTLLVGSRVIKPITGRHPPHLR